MSDLTKLAIISILVIIAVPKKNWHRYDWFCAIGLSFAVTPIIGFPAWAILKWLTKWLLDDID